MMMVPYFVAVVLAVGGMEAPAPSPAELVQQLGAEEFKAREAASAALRDLGAAALPAVEAGTRSSGAEIAFRCRVLLRQLRERQMLDQIDAVRGGVSGWKSDANRNRVTYTIIYEQAKRASSNALQWGLGE